MASEFSALYKAHLDWVYERAEGKPNQAVDLRPFATEHGLDDQASSELLQYGVSKGGLDDKFATFGEAAANLTPKGLESVERRRKRREPPVERSKAARRALLRWVWVQEEVGAHWPTVEHFVGSADASFEDSAFTSEEIERAAGYLKKHGLINGQGAWERKGPIRAEITVEGQDCVEHYDGDPEVYVQRHTGGTTYNNYMPNAKGVIIGEQQHFTQNNTDGVDPRLFAQLAGYIGQVSIILSMSDQDRVELERVGQDLHAEVTSPNPEPGRLCQFATQLKDKLLETDTTIAATMGVQMAEQALASLVQ
ncbi:hypothetical protein ACFYM5_33295 [Streptomyces sp. NPDC006706]|uniref:hypothetical protein n=1 Tax=Streptomyces sp. NPDC006706 TaxID=3364761 RepID=UPI0036A573D7